jgi:GNAT superfamily N-acetyltransferase
MTWSDAKMGVVIQTFFENPADLSVSASADNLVIGVANARIESDAMVLTFIAVRETCQRQGIGTELLNRLLAEAHRRKVARFVGENVRSAASWRLIGRVFGDARLVSGCLPTDLPEQPERVIFAPSFGMLQVEGERELTAEWILQDRHR